MKYTYEIIKVDETSRAMEVVYAHEKHGKQHVGVRLPLEGETLSDVIRQAAPTSQWQSLEKSVFVPEVGISGEIEDAPRTIDTGNEVLL